MEILQTDSKPFPTWCLLFSTVRRLWIWSGMKNLLLAIEEPRSSERSIYRSEFAHILHAASKLRKLRGYGEEKSPLSVNTLRNATFFKMLTAPEKVLTFQKFSPYKPGWNSENETAFYP